MEDISLSVFGVIFYVFAGGWFFMELVGHYPRDYFSSQTSHLLYLSLALVSALLWPLALAYTILVRVFR